MGSVSGGLGVGLIMVKLLDIGAATFRCETKRGGSCTQVRRPGIKEPGRPEDLPRTAAITKCSGRKKRQLNVTVALSALIDPGCETRSLMSSDGNQATGRVQTAQAGGF